PGNGGHPALGGAADDHPGGALQLHTLLPRRLARPEEPPADHGCVGVPGHWRHLCRRHLDHPDRARRDLFRLGGDVRLLPAGRARQRTVEGTARRVNLLPPSTLRVTVDGGTERILLEEVREGDLLEVKPGESIPADGTIVQGVSSIDESALSGEYLPLAKRAGDRVTAGTLNVEGPLQIRVSAIGEQTRLSAIVRLLERAQSEKPRLARLADRVAQYFLLIV